MAAINDNGDLDLASRGGAHRLVCARPPHSLPVFHLPAAALIAVALFASLSALWAADPKLAVAKGALLLAATLTVLPPPPPSPRSMRHSRTGRRSPSSPARCAARYSCSPSSSLTAR